MRILPVVRELKHARFLDADGNWKRRTGQCQDTVPPRFYILIISNGDG